MRATHWIGCVPALMLVLAACGDEREVDGAPQAPMRAEPIGAAQQAMSDAAVLEQIQAPLQPLGTHLAGLHVLKDDVGRQFEAHHYCAQVNDRLMQCAIFDSHSTRAHLIGVEYIIPGEIYDSLPQDEQRYWHPHNYEVLSGMLVAPELAPAAEKATMRTVLNTYGKTWHLWSADNGTAAPQDLPVGPPQLAWSFNRDGEAEAGLLRSFSDHVAIDLVARGRERSELTRPAEPQAGVDALKERFDGPTQSIPGVVDRQAAAAATADATPPVEKQKEKAP